MIFSPALHYVRLRDPNTGCDPRLTSCVRVPLFRNLSSVNERTRQKMREMRGLVDSLVAYVKNALQEDNANDKVTPQLPSTTGARP